MEAEIFWDLVEAASKMGRFVAAVPNAAASANIVGRLELGFDGDEQVLQKKNRPNCHIHFKPELIAEFAFIYLDPGFGPEPCLELRTSEGQPVCRLYYQGKKAVKRYDKFMKRNAQHEAFIRGSWSESEEVTADVKDKSSAADESIFISNHHATDAEADAVSEV
ncbi:MAG TPA: hypothetical protein VF666_09210 [Pyrinomonadaceae bacterium]|jgi:hypothetical protein